MISFSMKFSISQSARALQMFLAKLPKMSVPLAVWEISGWSWIPAAVTVSYQGNVRHKNGRRTENGLGLVSNSSELGALGDGNRDKAFGQTNELVEVAHEDCTHNN
jgi:hypothetical protein